jgi:hypothetical protein
MRVLLLTLPLLTLTAYAGGPGTLAQSSVIEAPADLPPPRTTTRVPPAPGASTPVVPAAQRESARGWRPAAKYGVEDFLLEAGALPDAREADSYSTFRAAAYALWQPSRDWEFRVGARADAMSQQGGEADHDELLADYTDTYARYRTGNTRLTLGAQTIVWGRVDEIPLSDRVSRVDLTRFILDDLPERRRAQLAARWEQNFGETKLDAVWLPLFRAAQLPDSESVWSPINRLGGRILGIDPALTRWLNAATRIDEDEHGSGGGALRLTGVARTADFGLTAARTRQSIPYYRLEPVDGALTAVHPFNTFLGADFEIATGTLIWRTEFGYTDDVPVTLRNAAMDKAHALDWIGALEFFPGGEDTRINLQLVAHALRTDQSILELKEYYGVNGEIETPFAQARWKAGLRFASGINVDDVYVSPRLSYVGWEPHEVYVAAHYFDGDARTLGGFHEDHSLITLGLRSRF